MSGGEFKDSNRLTLEAYQADWEAYVAGTPTVIPEMEGWLKLAPEGLEPPVKIFEFGSGTGRDALWFKSLGYDVNCSDATPAFVDLLQQRGLPARQLNVLTDDLPAGYDLILAVGVMHHFQPAETKAVAAKAARALNPGGRFAFSLKEGQGQEWYHDKLDRRRYHCRWQEAEIDRLLKEGGFDHVRVLRDTSYKKIDWLSIIAAKDPAGPVKARPDD